MRKKKLVAKSEALKVLKDVEKSLDGLYLELPTIAGNYFGAYILAERINSAIKGGK